MAARFLPKIVSTATVASQLLKCANDFFDSRKAIFVRQGVVIKNFSDFLQSLITFPLDYLTYCSSHTIKPHLDLSGNKGTDKNMPEQI